MTKVIISEKQRNLIIESETAKKSFKELYTILEKHKTITEVELQEMPQLSNLKSYYKELLNSCRVEWEIPKTNATRDLGKNHRRHKSICQLCNYKYLKIENIIVNKISKKRLIIGSECTKEFGTGISSELDRLRKYEKRAQNIKHLEEKIPGIRSFMDSYTGHIDSYEIIVSESLYSKWSKTTSEISVFYNDIIRSEVKIKDSDVKKLTTIWGEIEKIKKDINDFVVSHKNEKYIAKRNILEWLKSERNQLVIDRIRADGGYITWFSAHRIYENEFMKEILLDLAPSLKELGIVLTKIKSSSKKVNLTFNKNRKSIIGMIDYNYLIMECGGVLFGKEIDYSFEDVYNNCQIEAWESIEKVLSLTKNSNYRLNNKYIDDNELIFVNNNKYILIDLYKVIKEFKKYYFSSRLDKEKTNQLIESLSDKVMNKEEFDLHEEIKKEAKEFENI